MILYATSETCFTILKGLYHFGANFFDLTFILRLCESNNTLFPVTNDLGVLLSLMHFSRDFCASVHALASSSNLVCAPGTVSSGTFRFAVGLIPVINWCGMYFVLSLLWLISIIALSLLYVSTYLHYWPILTARIFPHITCKVLIDLTVI